MQEYNYLNNIQVKGKITSYKQGELVGSFTQMPTPSQDYLNSVIVYTGQTTQDFVQNRQYMCVLNDSTYSWVDITPMPEIDLEPNKVVVSDENGDLDSSAVTSEELGYLSGVTSSIQEQLDDKVEQNPTTITPGTKCKITYNENGLVTQGQDLVAQDIPNIYEQQVVDLVDDLQAKLDKVNTVGVVYATDANGQQTVPYSSAQDQNALVQRQSNGNISVPTTPATTTDATSKVYVDTIDQDLQTQIDAIVASSDVKDIVGTYQELQNYDTSTLGNNDIIKVLQDSTHSNAQTYYRWVITEGTGSFQYIGSEGPYYTISQTDTLLQDKANKNLQNVDVSGAVAGQVLTVNPAGTSAVWAEVSAKGGFKFDSEVTKTVMGHTTGTIPISGLSTDYDYLIATSGGNRIILQSRSTNSANSISIDYTNYGDGLSVVFQIFKRSKLDTSNRLIFIGSYGKDIIGVTTAQDQGKALCIDSNGMPAWEDASKELPATLGTAGQVLTVNSGATGVEWQDAPEELPTIASGDAGKVLQVNAGETGVEWGTLSGGGLEYIGSFSRLVGNLNSRETYNISVSVSGLELGNNYIAFITSTTGVLDINACRVTGTNTTLSVPLKCYNSQPSTIVSEQVYVEVYKTRSNNDNNIVIDVIGSTSYQIIKNNMYITSVASSESIDNGINCAKSYATRNLHSTSNLNYNYTNPLVESTGHSTSKLVKTDSSGHMTANFDMVDPTSADAGKSLAINSAGTGIEYVDISEVPAYTTSDDGKILGVTVDSSGETPVAEVEWVDKSSDLPAIASGDAGKVLTVNSGETGVEWASVVAGGGYEYVSTILVSKTISSYGTGTYNLTDLDKAYDYIIISTADSNGFCVSSMHDLNATSITIYIQNLMGGSVSTTNHLYLYIYRRPKVSNYNIIVVVGSLPRATSGINTPNLKVIPALSGNANKKLSVNASADALEFQTVNEVPTPTASDVNKVLTATGANTFAWATPQSGGGDVNVIRFDYSEQTTTTTAYINDEVTSASDLYTYLLTSDSEKCIFILTYHYTDTDFGDNHINQNIGNMGQIIGNDIYIWFTGVTTSLQEKVNITYYLYSGITSLDISSSPTPEELPSVSGNQNKYLMVNSGATGVAWGVAYPPTTAGTSGQLWQSDGSGQGVWQTLDTTPTSNSTKAITSGAVYTANNALDARITALENLLDGSY